MSDPAPLHLRLRTMEFVVSERVRRLVDRLKAEIEADPLKAERRQKVLTCVYEGHDYPTAESACQRCGAFQVPFDESKPMRSLQWAHTPIRSMPSDFDGREWDVAFKDRDTLIALPPALACRLIVTLASRPQTQGAP